MESITITKKNSDFDRPNVSSFSDILQKKRTIVLKKNLLFVLRSYFQIFG